MKLASPNTKKKLRRKLSHLKQLKATTLKNSFSSSKWKFLSLKRLEKCFYGLNKPPLEETRCLIIHYSSVAAEASSFLIHIF